MIPDVDRDDRRLAVFVHDQRQAVVQHELLIRDVEFVGVPRTDGHQADTQADEMGEWNDEGLRLAHAG